MGGQGECSQTPAMCIALIGLAWEARVSAHRHQQWTNQQFLIWNHLCAQLFPETSSYIGMYRGMYWALWSQYDGGPKPSAVLHGERKSVSRTHRALVLVNRGSILSKCHGITGTRNIRIYTKEQSDIMNWPCLLDSMTNTGSVVTLYFLVILCEQSLSINKACADDLWSWWLAQL